MDESPRHPEMTEYLDSLLADLPTEVRQTVAGWIRRAREQSPQAVEVDLIIEARRMTDRFRTAADAVEKMMAG